MAKFPIAIVVIFAGIHLIPGGSHADAAEKEARSRAVTLPTKEWKIPPEVTIPGLPTNGSPASTGAWKVDREIVKKWLIAKGIDFPDSALALYIYKTHRLIVRDTQDQLDRIDAILDPPRALSMLVELECKLVEVPREEETVPPRFTAGSSPQSWDDYVLGSWSHLFPKPDAHVFSDPEMQDLQRKLDQQKGIGSWTAPKVTLKSGQSGQVDFIRKFRGPSKDSSPEGAPAPAPADVREVGGVLHSTVSCLLPADLKLDEVVTLDVRPVIRSEGYSVDLNLARQVMEFDEFKPDGRDQPVFSTRKTSESVTVCDDSTVVFGDLVHEEPQQQATPDLLPDKGPVIVRTNGTGAKGSRKPRLVLFVTAHLIDTGSRPVRSDDEKEPVAILQPPSVPPIDLPLTPR